MTDEMPTGLSSGETLRVRRARRGWRIRQLMGTRALTGTTVITSPVR
jgi:hypothetical protein